MPKVSNAAKLAEVQGKAVERILAKVRREVRDGFLTEERGEERMSRMLRLGEKLGPLNASEEAMAICDSSCAAKADSKADAS